MKVNSRRNGLNVEYLIRLTEIEINGIPRREKGKKQNGLRSELYDWNDNEERFVPTGKTAILNYGDIKDTPFGVIQRRFKPNCTVPFKNIEGFEFTIRDSCLPQIKQHRELTAEYANGNVWIIIVRG